MSNLKELSADLSSFLSTVKKPVQVEQAAPQPEVKSPEFAPKVENSQRAYTLARATFDYVSSQLSEQDGADTIGLAYMTALKAVAKDAGVSEGDLVDEGVNFLEGIVEAARGAI